MAEDERLELSHAFTWTVFKTDAVPIMLNPPYVVELSGFEPLTPCVQSKCSPHWAIAPYASCQNWTESSLPMRLLSSRSYLNVCSTLVNKYAPYTKWSIGGYIYNRTSHQQGTVYGTPRGTRTLDSRLKRALLYQLSYWRVWSGCRDSNSHLAIISRRL